MTKSVSKRRTSGRELDAYLRGRDAGYPDGVNNERILVLRFLEREIKQRTNVDERSALQYVAEQIVKERHVTVHNTTQERS